MALKRIPKQFAERVTPESQAAGALLAKITDAAEPAIRARFPNIAQRCKSCAFRPDTLPNACLDTVLEAFDCAIRGEPFYCHLRFNPDGTPRDLCGGWQIAIGNVPGLIAAAIQPAIDELRAVDAESPQPAPREREGV